MNNEVRLRKGYAADAGYDIILNKDIIIHSGMNIIDLELSVNVEPGQFAYLCSRTSAAKQGILVQQCPIDANYTGNIHAIVYNANDKAIVYKEGTAFCQLVYCLLGFCNNKHTIKNKGERSNGAFGSTGGI